MHAAEHSITIAVSPAQCGEPRRSRALSQALATSGSPVFRQGSALDSPPISCGTSRRRKLTARLIAKSVGDAPLVLTGDFNAGEQNPAIQRLKQHVGEDAVGLVDSFRAVHPDEKTVGTFNAFEGRTDGDKIDYIFTSRAARVVSADILRTSRDSRYPSDHFPINAVLEFPSK